MHLHRERQLTIQQLHQQRKPLRSFILHPDDGLPLGRPQIGQRLAGMDSIRNPTDMQRVAAQLPRFSNRGVIGKLFSEMGEPPTSPQLGAQKRLEHQRFHETNASPPDAGHDLTRNDRSPPTESLGEDTAPPDFSHPRLVMKGGSRLDADGPEGHRSEAPLPNLCQSVRSVSLFTTSRKQSLRLCRVR